MRRTWLFCAVIALCPILALTAWRVNRVQADKHPGNDAMPQSKKIPLTQIVLFNTGLGYFQREGEVEGDARIDMQVPTADINDILKSLVIDNAGKPTSVSYEGTEPMETKLKAFQLDLATNPTLGDLLNQARGEKVELTVEGTGGGAAVPVTGGIVGMESHVENQNREVHYINIICTDGVRRLPLDRVQRVRFLDPNLEDEFRRALSVLAAGRSDQRRLVSVRLEGDGKRKVKFGHVAETPIWKATYRLNLDKDGKAALQGRAIVENMTDEDWKDVRVVLVNGRPITFRMELAQPLFMPRPTVEPEVFASLRPTTFAPAQSGSEDGNGKPQMQQGRAQLGAGGFQGGLGGQFQGGFGGGFAGGFGGNLGGWNPNFGGNPSFNRYQTPPTDSGNARLSYEQLMQRTKERNEKRKEAADQARELGSSLAQLANIDDIVTNADRIGEGFRHSVEPRVTLARQKSALLPIVDSPVSLARLSVYAPSVHPRFPLQALKLKNTTGQHLQQGPVAVYDEGQFVGDCQLPDVQPDQERLLTFSMDLGVEVRPEQSTWTEPYTRVEFEKHDLVVESRNHRKTIYNILNRSKLERTVLIEQAISTAYALAKESEHPVEKTREQYRFEWKLQPGKREAKVVQESHTTTCRWGVASVSDQELLQMKGAAATSAKTRGEIDQILVARDRNRMAEQNARAVLKSAKDEAAKVEDQLREAKDEMNAAKSALAVLPVGSAEHKRNLTKFGKYDELADTLKLQVKEKNAVVTRAQKELDELLGKPK